VELVAALPQAQPGTGTIGGITTVLTWARNRYAIAPLLFVAWAYVVLTTVRISGAYSSTLMVASIALTPLVLLAVPRAEWAQVGICRSRTRPALLLGVVTVLASYAATVTASYGAFGNEEDNWLTWMPRLFVTLMPGSEPLQVLTGMICLGILVPVVEEICYRGVLFEAVQQRFGPMSAVVLTSLMWSLVHLGDYGLNPYHPRVIVGCLLSVLVMGLGLGICRQVTGSVLACIIAQGTGNVLLYAGLLAWGG
jgi:membrane protease YdiL (CAAX protease family)